MAARRVPSGLPPLQRHPPIFGAEGLSLTRPRGVFFPQIAELEELYRASRLDPNVGATPYPDPSPRPTPRPSLTGTAVTAAITAPPAAPAAPALDPGDASGPLQKFAGAIVPVGSAAAAVRAQRSFSDFTTAEERAERRARSHLRRVGKSPKRVEHGARCEPTVNPSSRLLPARAGLNGRSEPRGRSGQSEPRELSGRRGRSEPRSSPRCLLARLALAGR